MLFFQSLIYFWYFLFLCYFLWFLLVDLYFLFLFSCLLTVVATQTPIYTWVLTCSKATCGEVLVLPSRRLVRTTADNDFVICRNTRVDKACVTNPMTSAFCNWWWLFFLIVKLCHYYYGSFTLYYMTKFHYSRLFLPDYVKIII